MTNPQFQPGPQAEEKGESMFTPLDRIGQLTMRNLDIIDTRDKLAIYTRADLLSLGADGSLPRLGGKNDRR